MLDHWHPVLRSEDLGRTPRGIQVCGRELVLFRDETGRAGALDDRCPHRRMRLSRGEVREGRLTCPYHAWSFDVQGRGRTPAATHARPCAVSYEAEERHGAVWIRNAGASGAFPSLTRGGYRCLDVIHQRVNVSLELAVDNFAELEHSVGVHRMFGWEDLEGAETHVDASDDELRIQTRGKQKHLPPVIGRLHGIRRGDWLEVEAVLRFDPVRAAGTHRWVDGRTNRPGPSTTQSVTVFVPEDDERTQLVTFFFADPKAWVSRLAPLAFANKLVVRHELELDRRILEDIADKNPALKGMQLGRFDKPLGMARERIDRIYREAPRAPALRVASETA